MEFKNVKFRKLGELRNGEGQRGPWACQEFIVETQGQYPKNICMAAWNDKIDNITALREGDVITINADVESCEFNGKWYTSVKLLSVMGAATQQAPAVPQQPAAPDFTSTQDDDDDLPF